MSEGQRPSRSSDESAWDLLGIPAQGGCLLELQVSEGEPNGPNGVEPDADPWTSTDKRQQGDWRVRAAFMGCGSGDDVTAASAASQLPPVAPRCPSHHVGSMGDAAGATGQPLVHAASCRGPNASSNAPGLPQQGMAMPSWQPACARSSVDLARRVVAIQQQVESLSDQDLGGAADRLKLISHRHRNLQQQQCTMFDTISSLAHKSIGLDTQASVPSLSTGGPGSRRVTWTELGHQASIAEASSHNVTGTQLGHQGSMGQPCDCQGSMAERCSRKAIGTELGHQGCSLVAECLGHRGNGPDSAAACHTSISALQGSAAEPLVGGHMGACNPMGTHRHMGGGTHMGVGTHMGAIDHMDAGNHMSACNHMGAGNCMGAIDHMGPHRHTDTDASGRMGVDGHMGVGSPMVVTSLLSPTSSMHDSTPLGPAPACVHQRAGATATSSQRLWRIAAAGPAAVLAQPHTRERPATATSSPGHVVSLAAYVAEMPAEQLQSSPLGQQQQQQQQQQVASLVGHVAAGPSGPNDQPLAWPQHHADALPESQHQLAAWLRPRSEALPQSQSRSQPAARHPEALAPPQLATVPPTSSPQPAGGAWLWARQHLQHAAALQHDATCGSSPALDTGNAVALGWPMPGNATSTRLPALPATTPTAMPPELPAELPPGLPPGPAAGLPAGVPLAVPVGLPQPLAGAGAVGDILMQPPGLVSSQPSAEIMGVDGFRLVLGRSGLVGNWEEGGSSCGQLFAGLASKPLPPHAGFLLSSCPAASAGPLPSTCQGLCACSSAGMGARACGSAGMGEHACSNAGMGRNACSSSGTGGHACSSSGMGRHACSSGGMGRRACSSSGTGGHACSSSGMGRHACSSSGTGRHAWSSSGTGGHACSSSGISRHACSSGGMGAHACSSSGTMPQQNGYLLALSTTPELGPVVSAEMSHETLLRLAWQLRASSGCSASLPEEPTAAAAATDQSASGATSDDDAEPPLLVSDETGELVLVPRPQAAPAEAARHLPCRSAPGGPPALHRRRSLSAGCYTYTGRTHAHPSPSNSGGSTYSVRKQATWVAAQQQPFTTGSGIGTSSDGARAGPLACMAAGQQIVWREPTYGPPASAFPARSASIDAAAATPAPAAPAGAAYAGVAAAVAVGGPARQPAAADMVPVVWCQQQQQHQQQHQQQQQLWPEGLPLGTWLLLGIFAFVLVGNSIVMLACVQAVQDVLTARAL